VSPQPPPRLTDAAGFIRRHLRVAPVVHVPELLLYQTDTAIGLWELTEAMRTLHCHNGPRPPECPFRDEDDPKAGEPCSTCDEGGAVRPREQGKDQEHP
jgi:hypothetical protein